MTLADWFMVGLTIQYAVAAGLYALQGDTWKVLYWIGATAINIAILRLGHG